MQLTTGTELQNGKFRIISVLGQGGFGITYLAQQERPNRKVAIKEFFMKEHCNRDSNTSHVSVGSIGSKDLVERFKQKFLKEADLIASFDNANIIRIYDVFEENGTAYYVMEYLEGKSLKALVDESGALPEDVAVKYIRQVAEALKEVHENNLLHLDVKPANIMLDKKGNAVLIDFGISKHYDEAGHQTSSAGVGISEGYAPIEQYEAGALKTFTPVTDIYALGATLFFLLTGTRPPKASYVYDEGLPPMPETLSLTVRKAVESAMQPRRKDRPQSVKEFIALLENQDVIVGSEETEVVIDKTGTGQNAATGNAAVEENEIEVEVVETSSVAPEPAPRPQPEENQKKNKFLWIIILLTVICGAVGGFMLFGGGGDVKKDSAKDTSVQQPQIVDPVPVVEQTAELVIIGAPDGANVYVDGEYFDKTPLKGATISIGEHTIKVVKDGYETHELKETFTTQTPPITVNLKKSTALLSLSTNPTGASIYLDGNYIGTSNLSGYEVEQGSHKIKITKQDYKDIVETHNFSSGSKNLSFNLAEKGITPDEAFSKGWAACDKGNYAIGVKWYRKAAKLGNAAAQCNLGYCYDKGLGVSQSYTEAVKWYYKAAEQGNADAQCNLGLFYENGWGISQSYSEAVKWYRKAAEQGLARAQYSLGLCYEYNKGVSQSWSEAVKWYRKAAEQGDANAQASLGARYENGEGVPRNLTEAIKWYRKAAAQGHQNAKDFLKRLGY